MKFEDDLSNPHVADPLLPRLGLTTDDVNPHDPQHQHRRALGLHASSAGNGKGSIITHGTVTRAWIGGVCVAEVFE